MIHDGRILFMGTPEEVQHNPDPTIQKFITAELAPPKPR
jgi:ABC-type transporter Mla maintaining outer membrane lipid asymmetry ATPase subunit MlaF